MELAFNGVRNEYLMIIKSIALFHTLDFLPHSSLINPSLRYHGLSLCYAFMSLMIYTISVFIMIPLSLSLPLSPYSSLVDGVLQ